MSFIAVRLICALGCYIFTLRQSVGFLVVDCTHINKLNVLLLWERDIKPLFFCSFNQTKLNWINLSLSISCHFCPHFRVVSGKSVCLLLPLYDPLSSCLCLPTEAAHKELACMHGKGTDYREHLVTAVPNASSPLHSLSLNQPLFSLFSISPSHSLSVCLSSVTNAYTFIQPTSNCVLTIPKLQMCTKSSCETKSEGIYERPTAPG